MFFSYYFWRVGRQNFPQVFWKYFGDIIFDEWILLLTFLAFLLPSRVYCLWFLLVLDFRYSLECSDFNITNNFFNSLHALLNFRLWFTFFLLFSIWLCLGLLLFVQPFSLPTWHTKHLRSFCLAFLFLIQFWGLLVASRESLLLFHYLDVYYYCWGIINITKK